MNDKQTGYYNLIPNGMCNTGGVLFGGASVSILANVANCLYHLDDLFFLHRCGWKTFDFQTVTLIATNADYKQIGLMSFV